MKHKTLRMIFLFCLLTMLSTTAAAADSTLSVTRAEVSDWNLLHLTEKYTAPEYQEKIAGILPKTAVVTLSDSQTVEVSLQHAWTPDPNNSRWTNSVSLSDLPPGTTDPQEILNTLSITWSVENYTGGFSVSPQSQIIGQAGSFSMWRYMSGTDRVELWQIPADGGSALLRATQDSGGYSESGNSSQYAVSAWTAEDAGEWFGLYYSSAEYWHDAYLSGTCGVETGVNKVTRAAPNGWTLFRMTERYAVPEYLDIIADMLPQTVTVTLLDGQTLELPTQGTWTPDPNNSRWINSADASALPEGTADPDGVLNTVSVAWQIDNYTGGLSISPLTQMIGQEGSFTLGRYMLGTSRVEFWQIPADGGPAVLRGTQDSETVSDDGHSCIYTVDAWTAQDAGQWIGLYGFSNDGNMYLAGVQTAAPRTYTVTFRPSGGTLQGPELYQTVFDGNAYRLENTPPDPVRTNYQFEGWYTQSTGGESISVTPQTDFTADIMLYAHWSRLGGGSGANPAVSDGKELQTVEVAGISGARNRADNGYSSNWSQPAYANLYRNPDGTFVTVDCTSDNSVVITFWDRDFQQTGQKQLPAELPIFGGFFHGETYNYIAFGQENPEEDDTKEVFRIVKYDQNFNRISAAAARDCYTCIPFDAGSCRMAESGNHLTIHTARERYLTEDGLHHQSQITITVNTDTMEVENDLGAFQDNHVSHSFNQFVLYDGEEHALLDHGDAYPRSIVLHQSYKDSMGRTSYRRVNLMEIPGPTGYNWTGVSVGGFAQSDDFYLAAINTVRQDAVSYGESKTDGHTLDSDERDVVLLSCSKYMDSGSVRQDAMTDYYQTGVTAGTPYLVPMGENRYAMLWQEFTTGTDQWGYSSYQSKGVRYAVVNGNADLLTDAVLLPDARLSRYCQPVADGDSVVWYVDTDNTRSFYRLSLSGDIPADPNPTPTAEPTTEPTPTASPTPTAEPEIQSVVLSDNLVAVTLSGNIPADSVLFAAVYSADGQFVRANRADVTDNRAADATDNHISVSLAAEQGMFVRVFLLDQSFRPLCPMKQSQIL